MTTPRALFVRESQTSFRPTELTRGPWSPDALHGGPVAALLAYVAEAQPTPVAMQPARLTIELLRAVPLAPLEVAARVTRAGKKVQWVEATLHAAGTEVARASLLRIRQTDLPLPASAGADLTPPPFPLAAGLDSNAPPSGATQLAYHSAATEHRAARGSWAEPGPITAWVRLRQPLLEGEELSPLQRVAAAADFGNGISWVLPYDDWIFINPDLTIHLARPLRGEWVGLDARTIPGPTGCGLAESALWDADGPIGRSLQSLLLERR